MPISALQLAKDMKKIELRRDRQPKLQSLDVEYMKLLELGSLSSPEIAAIVERKKALRDVTDLVDEATTIEEVNAVTLPE
jgi:hypothetical protein